jgi:hypothetical protein
VASTARVNHSFSFMVSYLNKCKDSQIEGPSGVIVGNSGVFPNVLILKNPRQLATYSIGFVETRHLRYSWWREASIELFRGCTRLEPFAKRLRIPFKISVRHSSLESRAAHTTRAPLIAS